MFLLLTATAQATNLDLLEVGGPWGTPAATDATAIWWNPAGLAAGTGTSVMIDVAPTLATVKFERDDPFNGGAENFTLAAPVPFIGVSTDFGVRDLGVGAGVHVPYAVGAQSEFYDEDDITSKGPGSYHLRKGDVRSIFVSGAAAWDIMDKVAIGFGGHLVLSEYKAFLDSETVTALNDTLCEELDSLCGTYSSRDDARALIEDPNYGATADMDLRDTAFTFSTGVHVNPVDQLAVSVAFVNGYRVDNTGTFDLTFGCPPESDTFGRLGTESRGLCNGTPSGTGSVGYNYPWRLQYGVKVMPLSDPHVLGIELMGGYTAWKAYSDFEIAADIDPSTIEIDNDVLTEEEKRELQQESKQLVDESATKDWARDSQNAIWIGVDGKGRIVDDKLTLGGRVIYTAKSVPDAALSPNNFDADTIIVGALVAFRPVEQFEFGLSFSRHQWMTREISNSAFRVNYTEDEAGQLPERYFYPTMNGTYGGGINRIGVTLRGLFGTNPDKYDADPASEG